MAEFNETQPLMSKDTGDDTYMLLRLTAAAVPSRWSEVLDEGSGETYYFNTITGERLWEKPDDFDGAEAANPPINIFIDKNDNDNNRLIETLTNKLEKYVTDRGLPVENLQIYTDAATDENQETIETPEELIKKFMNHSLRVNFTSLIQTQLKQCFPGTPEETARNHLIDTQYTHYGLFSYNNFVTYLQYLLLTDFTTRSEDEMLFPYSFLTIQDFKDAKNPLKIQETPSSEWKNTNGYMIYNVCKSHKIEKKGVCSEMMSIITNSSYSKKPLLLFVDKNNKAAINCYTKNKFQKIIDIFSDKDALPIFMVNNPDNIVMVYNRYKFKTSVPNTNPAGGSTDYELLPSGSYRFSIIAHGAVDIQQSDIFTAGFDVKKVYREYLFPFKNLQYYVNLGYGLELSSRVESNTKYTDICYDRIISTTQDTPENGTIKFMPMNFSGYQRGSDPVSREQLIGLYDCIMKTRVKENADLFGVNNDRVLSWDNLMREIYVYCNGKDIPLDNVEIKIFACRGFCPQGQFAVTTQQPRQDQAQGMFAATAPNKRGREEQPVVDEEQPVVDEEQPAVGPVGKRQKMGAGRGNGKMTDQFEANDKKAFLEFVIGNTKNLNTCLLPTKDGAGPDGSLGQTTSLSVKFAKMLAKTPVGRTFEYPDGSKTCYEVLENNHFKKVVCPSPKETEFSSEFAKMLAKTSVGDTFEYPDDSNKCYEVLDNKHFKEIDCPKKTGSKRTRRKKNTRSRKRKTRSKKKEDT
jgi:hypothetical protein